MWVARCLFCFWALAQVATAAEIEVSLRADTTQVTLGEPIELELVLSYPSDRRPDEPNLVELLADASFVVGARQGPVDTASGRQLMQKGQARFFELGSHSIPSIAVAFVSTTGDTLIAHSAPLDIAVVSVLGEGEEQLRDIKPPVVVVGGIELWIVVVLVLVVLMLLAGLIYWLVRRYRRGKQGGGPEPDPIDFAAEFARIADMGLLERGDFKIYYSLLSDNLRRFMERDFGCEAMEKTTNEIEALLRAEQVSGDIIRQVVGYLSTTDLVKFARFYPELESARRMPDTGLAILRDLEELVRARAEEQEAAEETHAEPSL
jgi:hypothetical protein